MLKLPINCSKLHLQVSSHSHNYIYIIDNNSCVQTLTSIDDSVISIEVATMSANDTPAVSYGGKELSSGTDISVGLNGARHDSLISNELSVDAPILDPAPHQKRTPDVSESASSGIENRDKADNSCEDEHDTTEAHNE